MVLTFSLRATNLLAVCVNDPCALHISFDIGPWGPDQGQRLHTLDLIASPRSAQRIEVSLTLQNLLADFPRLTAARGLFR